MERGLDPADTFGRCRADTTSPPVGSVM